jgi:RNA polymerase sigma factor (sigma-70 family)
VVTATATKAEREFSKFLEDAEARLRRALIGRYGPDVGRDAAAEALAYAWENWEKLQKMRNPAGYLFRVGQSKARKYRSKNRPLRREPAASGNPEPWVEPELANALETLSPKQRSAVLLIHGYGHTYEEAAKALGVTRSTIQRHVERGMAKLRSGLEVSDAS